MHDRSREKSRERRNPGKGDFQGKEKPREGEVQGKEKPREGEAPGGRSPGREKQCSAMPARARDQPCGERPRVPAAPAAGGHRNTGPAVSPGLCSVGSSRREKSEMGAS